MWPVKLLFAFGCHVSFRLRRGLTSWRRVTPPVGSVSSRKRCALPKKNSLFCFNGPPSCVVTSAYFVVFAGSASVGFLSATAFGTLLKPRLLFVPKKSNRPVNRLPPDLVIVLTTAPVKPPYSAGAPRPWNWYSSTTL